MKRVRNNKGWFIDTDELRLNAKLLFIILSILAIIRSIFIYSQLFKIIRCSVLSILFILFIFYPIYLTFIFGIDNIKEKNIEAIPNSKWIGKFKYLEVSIPLNIELTSINNIDLSLTKTTVSTFIKELQNSKYVYANGIITIKQIANIYTNYILDDTTLKLRTSDIIQLLKNKEDNLLSEVDFNLDLNKTGIILTNDICKSHCTLFYDLTDLNLLNFIKEIKESYLISYFRDNADDKIIDVSKKIDLLIDKDSMHYVDLPKSSLLKKLKKFKFTYLFENEKEVKEEDLIIVKNTSKEILSVIEDIDKMLNDGYNFKTISINRWKSGYKKEILKAEISKEREKEILNILSNLKESMYNSNQEKAEFINDATVNALNSMAKMDGII